MSDAFFDVVNRQRSCRSFRSDPVADDLIERMLSAATHAPSAENRQPWEFIVIRDTGTRHRVGELMLHAWTNGAQQWSEGRLTASLLDDVDVGMRGGVANAPVLIAACVDLDRTMEVTTGSSMFPAIQNLLLAATALGLGTALTTIATAFEQQLRALLALPETVRVVAIIPLGWPERTLGPPRRNPFATHTHRETYGTAW